MKNISLFLTSLISLALSTAASASVDGLSGMSGLIFILLLLGTPVLACWIFVKVISAFVKPERKSNVITTVGCSLLLALFSRMLFGVFVSPFDEGYISFIHWMTGSFILAGMVGIFAAVKR